MRSLINVSLIFFGLLLFSCIQLNAQHIPMGAESAGMAYASAAYKGRAGIFDNSAGLTAVRNKEILAAYNNKYGFVEGLSTVSAAYLHPFSRSTAALSFTRFGDELFSQHIISLNYAHQIDHFSMGIRLNEHQYQMEGTNTRYITVVDLGGIMQLLPSIGFGMSISNLNQAFVSRETGEKVPTVLSSGLCYRPDEKITTLIELCYELENRPLLKFGMAYQPVNRFVIRSGVDTERLGKFFLGLGLMHNVIDFDYALETHTYLGISQQFNVVYKFRKDAKE
jgi:hypothetical protein